MWIEVHNNGARLSRYTYRCAVLPDHQPHVQRPRTECLNAPTGAWCSLTGVAVVAVVLMALVSMHLQVRGAP